MSLAPELAGAIAAVEIEPPVSFRWFGAEHGRLADEVSSRLSADDARRYLVHQLGEKLYDRFYCRGVALPDRGRLDMAPSRGTPLADMLSRANGGTGPWEPGWEIVAAEERELVAVKDGLRVWAGHDECVTEDGTAPKPGAAVRVRLPKELLKMSPGFYMALGDEPLGDAEEVVRLYFNVGPEGAVPLMSAATRELNGAGVPFRLKVLGDTESYGRCDAAVAYLPRSRYAEAAAAVRGALGTLDEHLGERVPAFTKRLSHGLGLAEDPGRPGVSFGMHRCGLLAEALVEAHERGKRDLVGRAAAVAGRFDREGIALDAPYLNPGSVDDYEL